MKDDALIYLLKFPEKGKIKTRLARDVGEDFTLRLYECFISDTLKTLATLRCRVYMFLAPAEKTGEMAMRLKQAGYDFPVYPQQGADLGERMRRAFENVFHLGHPRSLIIGSDFPDLPAERLTEALTLLGHNDAVIGPTWDGGYFMLGFRKDSFCSSVFHQMPWSTDRVCRITVSRLEAEGLRVHKTPSFADVDTLEDLRELAGRNTAGDFKNSSTMHFLMDHRPLWQRDAQE